MLKGTFFVVERIEKNSVNATYYRCVPIRCHDRVSKDVAASGFQAKDAATSFGDAGGGIREREEMRGSGPRRGYMMPMNVQ